MEIIKENWKVMVFVFFAILILIKLDDLSSNGRYVPVSGGSSGIVDTRNGKVYIPKEIDGPTWKQTMEEVK